MKAYRDAEKTRLVAALEQSDLCAYCHEILELFTRGWDKVFKHGDLPRWASGFHALPNIMPSSVDLQTDTVRIGQVSDATCNQSCIEEALQAMHPWRKGPFDIFGVHIHTEWRSDWKWKRLQKHISPLKDRTVLDVGCGSGYHMWRMLGDGADMVLGIDPTPLFSMHFATVKRYVPDAKAHLLPVGIDDMPKDMHLFDSVFSMGILYHRKSPLEHLEQLKNLLCQGGEVILETLVVEGDVNTCLVPQGRYAKMRNVWFIPSVEMLTLWMGRCGFKHIRCVDVSVTSMEEQRATDWMRFESLDSFLDESDKAKTIEGYPAPKRAIMIAESV